MVFTGRSFCLVSVNSSDIVANVPTPIEPQFNHAIDVILEGILAALAHGIVYLKDSSSVNSM